MTLVNTETGEIASTINYEIHPAAQLFPLVEGADFEALVKDIREHGQMEPVVLDASGRLIDGRNRARACQVLGVDVKETRYSGEDVTQYVVSHNLHRRHLTDSQRAMIAARLANLPRGGDRGNQYTGGKTPDGVLATRTDVKQMLGVSEGSMQRAKVIERSGTPDLVALTSEGKVPLATAARVAEADAEDQDQFVRDVRGGAEATKASQKVTPKPAQIQPTPTSKTASGNAFRSPAVREQRAELIRELAAQGYSSRQMPEKVGVSELIVRRIARDFDIEIPADRYVGGTRRINSTQLVENTATALEGLVSGVELIDYDAVDPEVASQWAASLKDSLQKLQKLARFADQIRKATQ